MGCDAQGLGSVRTSGSKPFQPPNVPRGNRLGFEQQN